MPQPTPNDCIQVEINGECHSLAQALSVAELLGTLDLAGKRVAIAINRDVILRGQYTKHTLAHGDRIEILEAVGGG